MQKELSFNDRDSSKGSSLVLIEGKRKTTSGRSKDKQSVWLRNENSNMVLCLRNRAMRMKDCAYDLNRKNEDLRQFVNSEKVVKEEIAEIRFNECKLNRRLDTVHRERRELAELLTWLKSSNDYVSRVERLVNQRTHRQRYLGQNFRKPLVQKAPRNVRVSGSKGYSPGNLATGSHFKYE